MGAEAEPGQEQDHEQDFEWTAEFEATGSTTGDTGSNITMSKEREMMWLAERERKKEHRNAVRTLRRIVECTRRYPLNPLRNTQHQLVRRLVALQWRDYNRDVGFPKGSC